ncbi:MAG: hypothetical protein I8H96_13195 [Sphingomonadaceae bacterium]|nr:hypothetical protein [Sphingomonadaceae bacterium]
MNGVFRPWLCAMALMIGPQTAMAAPAVRLDTQMFVERVTMDINGRARRTLASADHVGPGDQLIVIVEWRNEGRAPVKDVAVTRPVPRSARIASDDPAMQVSIDGGAHWGRLDDMWLPTPLGGSRRAVAGDVTHVRWLLSDAVPPGQSGRLSYRATVQ